MKTKRTKAASLRGSPIAMNDKERASSESQIAPFATFEAWNVRHMAQFGESYDIYQGDELVCPDLLYREATAIVNAHNNMMPQKSANVGTEARREQ
jgi:hypothetical protein